METAEPIAIAELLPGHQVHQEKSINPVYKAQVHIDGKGELSAFVKSLPDRELLMECLCAKIGRLLGLPIPRPLLVIAAPDSCPPGHDIKKPLFGSETLEHPSARRFVCPYGEIDRSLYHLFIEKLNNWKQLADAALFDEHFANHDRHGGNYLFDGETLYLIDHGLAFHKIFTHQMSAQDPVPDNDFMSILSRQDEISRRRAYRSLQKTLAKLGQIDIDTTYHHSLYERYADDLDVGKKTLEIYRKRIEYITDIVSEKLGIKTNGNLNKEFGSW